MIRSCPYIVHCKIKDLFLNGSEINEVTATFWPLKLVILRGVFKPLINKQVLFKFHNIVGGFDDELWCPQQANTKHDNDRSLINWISVCIFTAFIFILTCHSKWKTQSKFKIGVIGILHFGALVPGPWCRACWLTGTLNAPELSLMWCGTSVLFPALTCQNVWKRCPWCDSARVFVDFWHVLFCHINTNFYCTWGFLMQYHPVSWTFYYYYYCM